MLETWLMASGQFETQEWSLETEDGKKIQLLDEGKADPIINTTLQSDE